ncbi:hypothetical protein SLA2020_196750 [Shorea laevis]
MPTTRGRLLLILINPESNSIKGKYDCKASQEAAMHISRGIDMKTRCRSKFRSPGLCISVSNVILFLPNVNITYLERLLINLT